MKDMDWKLLTVLYEKQSITQAAEALFMTQSALTKRIRAIEAEWQIELVKRSSRGIMFTEDGTYLAQRATVMLDFLQEIETHFSASRSSRELLRIGVPNSFSRLHMPGLLKEYKERYDRLQIVTVPKSSDFLIQQLTDGTVDICMICGDYPYLGEKICLFEEELYMVVRRGMKLDDIAGEPLIRSFFNPMVSVLVDQWWKNYFGSLPHESYRVPYLDIALEMVEKGLGVTFLFGKQWQQGHESLELLPVYRRNGEPISRKVWMMMSDGCFKSSDIMDFVSMVEEHFKSNQ